MGRSAACSSIGDSAAAAASVAAAGVAMTKTVKTHKLNSVPALTTAAAA